jgi:hypothetical protein
VLDELPVLSELLFALHPVGDVGEKALDERRTAHCLADDATPVTDPALGPALGDDRVTHLELVFGRELCLHPLPDPGRRRRHEVRPERDSAGLERGCRVSGEPLDVARGELDRSLRPVLGVVSVSVTTSAASRRSRNDVDTCRANWLSLSTYSTVD